MKNKIKILGICLALTTLPLLADTGSHDHKKGDKSAHKEACKTAHADSKHEHKKGEKHADKDGKHHKACHEEDKHKH